MALLVSFYVCKVLQCAVLQQHVQINSSLHFVDRYSCRLQASNSKIVSHRYHFWYYLEA